MLLPINAQAPDFVLPDSTGKPVSLEKDLKGEPVVLFFYPKDHTRVCTAEVCAFRDVYAELREQGVEVFGISGDSVATHADFKARQGAPFELLADTDRTVAKTYGALFLGLPRRVTYLLDAEHRVVLAVANFLSAEAHVDGVLDRIKQGL